MMNDFRALGERLRNWDRWGADDRIGTLNLITADHVAGAGKLIRKGKIFDLSIALGANGPAIGTAGRLNPVHHMIMTPADAHLLGHMVTPPDVVFTDDWIAMPLQCATQWDGLGHAGYDGCFYNNVGYDTVTTLGGSSVLSISDIIAKGPVGRGVLLDIAALHGGPLASGYEITPEHLEAAEKRQNVRVGPGDILLIRTGWIQHFTHRRDLASFWEGEPGIGLGCVEWLYKREVAALASDNYAVEVVTPGGPASMVCHCVLIRDMGMTLGEIFDLDALAADCVADGVWEFFFTCPPLKVERGVGSPITPLAIK